MTILTFPAEQSDDPCIYFCGNSLGLQPRAVPEFIQTQLDTWSTIGVHGHFRQLEDSPLSQWQLLAEHAAARCAPIVGAATSEVAIMGTVGIGGETLSYLRLFHEIFLRQCPIPKQSPIEHC